MGAKWNLKTIVDLLEEVTISRISWNIPKKWTSINGSNKKKANNTKLEGKVEKFKCFTLAK
jgi:hypothetical protein